MDTKYIFMSGGVVSSLGKGLTSASIAMLLEKRGHTVAMLKLDPYLNVDPGTMNPFEHGEVYVLDDGAETDLDLGHYFRYTNSPLSKASNATSGQILNTVIKKERKGDYLGKTVQVIPHVTDEIKNRIKIAANQNSSIDIVIVEIGGTVGDIESLPFFEAIRQFRYENHQSCLHIHLTHVPFLKAAGEVKTKPTQHSVQVLRGIGIIPDIILCRCDESLEEEVKEKISLFCSVPKANVIDEPDVEKSIYEVPLMLHKQGLDEKICSLLHIASKKVDLSDWEDMLHCLLNPRGKVTIGIVGKYLQHQDAYKSVFEALHHGAMAQNVTIEIRRYESDKILHHHDLNETLAGCDGILVPGGFGERGWIGKIMAAKHCRENKVPYFGLCLGMQVLCVEFCRHVLDLHDANTTEINPLTSHPVISMLSEQQGVKELGGTMRLGSYPCKLTKGSKAHTAYGENLVYERHRHRFEFNNAYKELVEKKGLAVTGVLHGGNLCEIVEVLDHPWMVGVQFHPEFKSKPLAPHPLFINFIAAALQYQKKGDNG